MFTKVLFGAVSAATVSFLFVLCAIVFTDWHGNEEVAKRMVVGCYDSAYYSDSYLFCRVPKTAMVLGDLGENILLGLCTVWSVLLVVWPMLPSSRQEITVLRERIYDNTMLILDKPLALEEDRQPLLPGIDG